MSAACRVVTPRDLADALSVLRDATAATRMLAGGTDLMVELEAGRTSPDLVVNLWSLDELRGVRADGDGLRIGALTTCAELLREPAIAARADLLAMAAATVGAVQIRARATIGGNLGTASPAADLNVALVALGASVELRSTRGVREVPCEAFLVGYRRTARQVDEVIESIRIPARAAGERRAFRKVGTRAAQSISKLVVAVAVEIDDRDGFRSLRGAAGSLADRTVALPTLAAELVGRPATEAAIRSAVRESADRDIAPIDDVRSTAAYRREVFVRVLSRVLLEVRA